MSRVRNAIFACLAAAIAASAAVDPVLLNLVMPDAKVISGIQVDASKASPFGRYVLSKMQSDDPGFQKFIAETGFDPRRDLSEIVAASAGTSEQPVALIAGRGVFNAGKIFNTAVSEGATKTNYNGVDLLTHSNTSIMGAVGFLDGSTAVMGNLDAVKAAIDRYKANAVLPTALTDRARAVAAANDAWFLSTVPVNDFFAGKIADPNLKGAMAGNLLQAVQQANGGVKFGSTDIRISGEAVTKSAKDATALADVVRFIAGMVQLNKDNSPEAQKIASLLDTMTVTTQDAKLLLSLSIPEELVEKLFMPNSSSPAKARRKTASLH